MTDNLLAVLVQELLELLIVVEVLAEVGTQVVVMAQTVVQE